MKKVIYILLILVLGIGIIIGLYYYKDYKQNNANIIKMKVVSVSNDKNGKSFDFEDGTGYYIETEDGNLWKTMKRVKVGDVVIFDTLGTQTIYDDIIINIE